MLSRRKFLGQVSSIALSASCSNILNPSAKAINKANLNLNPAKPKAVAMWDYSWLLRSYSGGGFDNWKKAIDELAERGYNALRIDCFPQFISTNYYGASSNEYFLPKKNWRPALWGNQYSLVINPRNSLLEFLRLCQNKNISVILSTWFQGHGTDRNKEFKGTEGLISSWNETIQLLDENDLLNNVLYIDVLNEFPLWHGYEWLHTTLNKIKKLQKPFDFLNQENSSYYNLEQQSFYNQFIDDVLKSLKNQWPELSFTTSQTCTLNTNWKKLNLENHEVLDVHLWMVYNKVFSEFTGYFENIHKLKNDIQFRDTLVAIETYRDDNRENLHSWLEQEVKERADMAHGLNIPLGNTEGWGAVMWMEHPHLNWNFIKDCGLLGAELGAKYNYSFNCSSNFTHPHFKTLWDDIDWHKKVTSIIRKL